MRKLLFRTLQYSWFMLGLFLISVSVVLMVQAQLGPSPWDVFHLGLTNYLPFTLGQIMIGVGVVMVGISWILGVRPYVASVVNMILIGVFVDLIFSWGWFPAPQEMVYRVLYMLVGIALSGLATGIYLSAKLGSGPRDSLMVALYRITGWRLGIVRTLIEVSVVILGYLLGGLVGVGTLLVSVTIGWFTEFFLNLFQGISHKPIFKKYVLSLLEPEEPKRNLCYANAKSKGD